MYRERHNIYLVSIMPKLKAFNMLFQYDHT